MLPLGDLATAGIIVAITFAPLFRGASKFGVKLAAGLLVRQNLSVDRFATDVQILVLTLRVGDWLGAPFGLKQDCD